MLLIKLAILWSAICFPGTSGQFSQDEVYVDVQELPMDCVDVAKENDIFLVHYRAYLPGDIMFFSRYMYMLFLILIYLS
jgi:hypothetical protein